MLEQANEAAQFVRYFIVQAEKKDATQTEVGMS